MRVIYLGENMESFVRRLFRKYEDGKVQRGVLFFSWKPTLLTSDFDLLSVLLPDCNGDSFCNYESGKVEKFAWKRLKEGAKLAFEVIKRISNLKQKFKLKYWILFRLHFRFPLHLRSTSPS